MFGVSCAETTYRLMADPCAEGIVVFSDEGEVRDGNTMFICERSTTSRLSRDELAASVVDLTKKQHRR